LDFLDRAVDAAPFARALELADLLEPIRLFAGPLGGVVAVDFDGYERVAGSG
jgi:hypothetical protein